MYRDISTASLSTFPLGERALKQHIVGNITLSLKICVIFINAFHTSEIVIIDIFPALPFFVSLRDQDLYILHFVILTGINVTRGEGRLFS